MNILQITTAVRRGKPTEIYGIGDDCNIYCWNRKTSEWEFYSDGESNPSTASELD